MSADAGVPMAAEMEGQKRRLVHAGWGTERESLRRLCRPETWGSKERRPSWKLTGQAQ